MEIFIYYVIPNVIMFGSLYLMAKTLEAFTWYAICDYEKMMENKNG
jgi:hypothetical protein